MRRLSLLLSLVAGFCSMSMECKDSTRVEYYRHVTLNGKLQFVGKYPLTPQEAKKVNCYRFTYQYDDYPTYMVGDWSTKIEYLKRGKRFVSSKFGADRIEIYYTQPYYPHQRWEFWDEDLRTSNYDNVYYVEITFDSLLFPIEKKNLNLYGEVMKDKYGVATYHYTYDAERDQLLTLRIDENGDTLIDEDGVYIVGWRLDEEGKVIEKTFYDKDCHLIRNFEGYAAIRYTYDEFGNNIKICYYDEEGRLCEENEEGFAVLQCVYDSYGYLVESRCYGADGRLQENKKVGAAVFRLFYDSFGNLVEGRYFGADGKQVEIKDFEIASYKIEYDRKGRQTYFSYFDDEGEPKMAANHKYARMNSEYNWEGKALEARYLNERGELTNNIDGNAVVKWRYGLFGRLNSIKSYDEEGKLVQVYYERPRRTLRDFLGICE